VRDGSHVFNAANADPFGDECADGGLATCADAGNHNRYLFHAHGSRFVSQKLTDLSRCKRRALLGT
jgi:hypothetical protein